jgi:hypothetical protein
MENQKKNAATWAKINFFPFFANSSVKKKKGW